MAELERLGSLLLREARVCVPAGGRCAGGRSGALLRRRSRERSSRTRGSRWCARKRDAVPEGLVVIASGPLTSPALSAELARLAGEEHLYFFDALSPIVEAETIDLGIAFRGLALRSRPGTRGRLPELSPRRRTNTRPSWTRCSRRSGSSCGEFEGAIREGVRAGMDRFFEGCLPVEIIAERGRQALAFGPLRPVGLRDPRTGKRPHAVVQLRQDNAAGSLYNLVGLSDQYDARQAQRRVLRMIPGPGAGAICPLRPDASQHLRERAAPASADAAASWTGQPVPGRADSPE